jgi:hypothetical protein
MVEPNAAGLGAAVGPDWRMISPISEAVSPNAAMMAPA